MENSIFTLRKLCADDMFLMFRILSKVGFKEVKRCFDTDDVKALVAGGKADASSVGVSVAFEMAGLLLEHLPECKNEIYAFLESLSGIPAKDIAALDMAVFAEMIVAVIRKEEFHDFFTAVARLFKQAT